MHDTTTNNPQWFTPIKNRERGVKLLKLFGKMLNFFSSLIVYQSHYRILILTKITPPQKGGLPSIHSSLMAFKPYNNVFPIFSFLAILYVISEKLIMNNPLAPLNSHL